MASRERRRLGTLGTSGMPGTYVEHGTEDDVLVYGLASARVHGSAASDGQPAAELKLVSREGLAVGYLFGHILRASRAAHNASPNVVHAEDGFVVWLVVWFCFRVVVF